MASSLSTLLIKCTERIHKHKCKYGQDDKNCKACGITYEICNCFHEYINFKVEHKCFCSNKNYHQKFDKN